MPVPKKNAPAPGLPRWAQLMPLALYMDQVILILSQTLAPFCSGEEAVITPAMVNNYVKHRLVPPPEKKKYGREQVAVLIFVSLMKRVLAMSEITALTAQLTAVYGNEGAYDLFCDRFEGVLQGFYAGNGLPLAVNTQRGAPEDLLDAAVIALCAKLYLQRQLPKQPPGAPPESRAGRGA